MRGGRVGGGGWSVDAGQMDPLAPDFNPMPLTWRFMILAKQEVIALRTQL